MTNKETEIEAAVRSVIAEGREQLGPPPTVESLMAYDQGRLSPEEEEQIQELLAHYPDSVRLLEAVSGYPDAPEPGDPDHLTEADLEREWQAIQDHLPGGEVVPFERPARQVWIQRIGALAATLLFAVLGISYLRVQQQVEASGEPQTTIEARQLIPDRKRTVRGPSNIIDVPSGKANYFFTLQIFEQPMFPDYRLEIYDLDDLEGSPLWQTTGLERQPGDTFALFLPGDFLEPDRVLFKLIGVRGEEEKELATYTVDF